MELAQVVHTAVAAVADRIAAGTTTRTDTTVDHLYRSIARKLDASVIGARLLKELENQPTATTARRDATQAVAAEAEADQHFAAELRHLVDQLTRNLPHAYRPNTTHTPPAPSTDPTPGPPPRHPQPNTGAIVLIAAVAVILLTISTTLLVKLVLPQAGLTEGARLDKISGTWTGPPPNNGSLTIRPDGTFAIADPNWNCPGRVSSPGRSVYVLEMDCGLFRTSFDGKLNLLGDKLTLSAPGSPETTVLTRQ
ncbi:hypothetical protein E0H26_00775 [Micromonospora zingiberis]|uniref:Uncharacterized protein n=1 Tax=Micromonospora zingiberis TaxID=2053011 RepID=A0A4R0GW75_9ACTN|nr:hypothetical protein [Micromonospora zingiberis]TCC00270.1 hypothetical protein E0H26_00775 [Micromonospora zingiberis]